MKQGGFISVYKTKGGLFMGLTDRVEIPRRSRAVFFAMEAGAAKAIDQTDDLAACKKRQTRTLQGEYPVIKNGVRKKCTYTTSRDYSVRIPVGDWANAWGELFDMCIVNQLNKAQLQ
jgi:hypothetical protein